MSAIAGGLSSSSSSSLQLTAFFTSLSLLIACAWSDCQFPVSWRGDWYQSGLGQVIISSNVITHKGTCHEHHRDYFLVENRQDNCRQCLLIISRHANIIQYKESFCLGPEPMHTLCSKIRVEAVLYTLVKEPSAPVSCPLLTNFQFIYNNNSGGFCRQPVSHVSKCAADSRLQFTFRWCPGFAYTSDRGMVLECLATWKDGSDMFVYGVFATDGLVTKEDTYRCFMYKVVGNVVFLSMSADATCRGLRSPTDGPLIMELTEDYFPVTSCEFPAWMSQSARVAGSWRDLSGKYRYVVQNRTLTYSRRSLAVSGGAVYHVLSNYQCVRLFQDQINESATDFSSPPVVMLARLLDDWSALQQRFQCLRIMKRDFSIVQIEKGEFLDDAFQRCSLEDFVNPLSNQLLISSDVHSSKSCPFVGQYRSATDDTGCTLQVIAGCTDKAQLDVYSSCQSRPVLQLKCVLWWNEAETQFVLVHEANKESTGRLSCYKLEQLDGRVVITNSPECRQQTDNGSLTSRILDTYTFQNYLEQCPLAEAELQLTEVKTLDDQGTDDMSAGVYNHSPNGASSKPNGELAVHASTAVLLTRNLSLLTSLAFIAVICVNFLFR